MSMMFVSSGVWGRTVAEYLEEVHESANPAYVRVRLNETSGGDVNIFLEIEDVRYLAEVLPGLMMAHDAAERVRAEQVAAEKSAAKSRAA